MEERTATNRPAEEKEAAAEVQSVPETTEKVEKPKAAKPKKDKAPPPDLNIPAKKPKGTKAERRELQVCISTDFPPHFPVITLSHISSLFQEKQRAEKAARLAAEGKAPPKKQEKEKKQAAGAQSESKKQGAQTPAEKKGVVSTPNDKRRAGAPTPPLGPSQQKPPLQTAGGWHAHLRIFLIFAF